jgi:hypothetical protein
LKQKRNGDVPERVKTYKGVSDMAFCMLCGKSAPLNTVGICSECAEDIRQSEIKEQYNNYTSSDVALHPPKKKNRGCIVTLIVLASIIGLVILIAIIGNIEGTNEQPMTTEQAVNYYAEKAIHNKYSDLKDCSMQNEKDYNSGSNYTVSGTMTDSGGWIYSINVGIEISPNGTKYIVDYATAVKQN